MNLVFVLTFAFCLAGPYDDNPFYVDEKTVKTDTYTIKMNLKNRHTSISNPSLKANPEIKLARVTFQSLDKRVMRFKMEDATDTRWEVPVNNPDKFKDYILNPIKDMGITYRNAPFGFTITDPMSKINIVSTYESTLKFFDKYIEFGARYPSQRVFGMGERFTPDFELCKDRIECIYTTFSKRGNCPLDEGKPPGGKNTYGHQPFYLIKLQGGYFMGVLFLNSNAQDARLLKLANGKIDIQHKTIGGIIDTYIFYPGRAELVLQKYHAFIGRPYVPPFWSLGYHQSRWGWKTLQIVKDVVAKFEQKDIPLDVIWSDLDYMYKYQDFTVDPKRFAGLKEFVKSMHKKFIRWVPILDPMLKSGNDCQYYVMGAKMNAFVKSAATKKFLVGKSRPGYTVIPDWYNPNTTLLWHKGLIDLHNLGEFDGIWLDKNEISQGCNGECATTEKPYCKVIL